MYNYLGTSIDSKTRKKIEADFFVNKQLSSVCYKNAYILPITTASGLLGGVVTHDGKEIKSSSIQQLRGTYNFDGKKIIYGHKAILIAVFTTYTWGHCFTDHFSKLWFLKTKQCQKLINEGAEIIYIATDNKRPPKYVSDLFNLAGLDLNSVKCVDNVTCYDELYIPGDSFFSGKEKEPRYYTKEYSETINDVKNNVRLSGDNINITLYPKIYLTRTQGKIFSSMLRDLGEKEIEKVFKNLGYKIIAPERHSVCEQIWLLMNCPDLVTTEGSIAHTAVFCNSGTSLTLIRKCNWISMHQLVMNEVAKLNVTYVDAHYSCFCDKREPWHGPFLMCVTKDLQHYVGHKIFHLPIFANRYFWLYCIRELYVGTIRKFKFLDKIIKRILE